MRKIKFRIWSIKDKCFVGSYFEGLNFDLSSGQIYSSGTNVTKDYVIMQYTGLNDKNGLEIYEGDIVITESGAVQHIEYNNHVGAFVCIESNSNLKAISSTDEVVGNIYSNSELINALKT